MIKISVIIPVYNASQYIGAALDSVINQTLKDIEIICVDDGSTDHSFQILQEYAEKDPRIIVLRQDNQYAGVARNYGMSIATGEYLSFLDADDYFEPDMLEKAYLRGKETDAEIVVFGGKVFKDSLQKAYNKTSFLDEAMIPAGNSFSPNSVSNTLFLFTNPAPWNKIFKRSFVEKERLLFQKCKRANDIYFVEMALALATKIGVVRENLISYRSGNEASLQGSVHKEPLSFLQPMLSLQEDLKQRNIYSIYECCFKTLLLEHSNNALDNIDTVEAYNEFRKGIFEKSTIRLDEIKEILDEENYEKYVFIRNKDFTQYMNSIYYKSGRMKPTKLFSDVISFRDNVIIYGASALGNRIYESISKKYNVISWVDAAAKRIGDSRVVLPSQGEWIQCEYVIVAAERRKTAEEIRSIVRTKYNINEERIIWGKEIALQKAYTD